MMVRLSGDQIRRLREAKGWSREKLAALTRTGPRSIEKWEAGEPMPSLIEARFTDVLGDIDDVGLALVIDPGGISEEVKSLYVWIAVHGDGDEGIAAVNGMPLMAAQHRVAVKLKSAVEGLARTTGKSMKLVRYDARAVLEGVKAPYDAG